MASRGSLEIGELEFLVGRPKGGTQRDEISFSSAHLDRADLVIGPCRPCNRAQYVGGRKGLGFLHMPEQLLNAIGANSNRYFLAT